jgi:hypothetical protein
MERYSFASRIKVFLFIFPTRIHRNESLPGKTVRSSFYGEMNPSQMAYFTRGVSEISDDFEKL